MAGKRRPQEKKSNTVSFFFQILQWGGRDGGDEASGDIILERRWGWEQGEKRDERFQIDQSNNRSMKRDAARDSFLTAGTITAENERPPERPQ
jgi:hypothetical protein